MINIYTLTETEAAGLSFAPDTLANLIQQIAYFSDTQDNLTANLTMLRNAAVKAKKKELFDKVLKAARAEILPQDMGGLALRFSYSAEDFENSEEPYMEVFSQPTAFLHNRALERLTREAQRCGYRSFKATYRAFAKSMRELHNGSASSAAINPTDFPQQQLELEAGEWNCDYSGVSRTTSNNTEVACLHPIMPVERLVNIDTGEEKLRIAFYKGRYWRSFIANKRDLFDSAKIIQFAAVGVAVTSRSARLLAEFLCDIETLNPELIPETESVGRLGYIGDGQQFSPYVDKLVFDGDQNYSTIYNAIKEHGSYEKWLDMAGKCRRESITAQIMLAAAFASPLIGKIGCLSFFVHLWGVESGTGKTVALMLAASVWGDPSIGQYIQTFNATQVGHEKTAAFLNNIPMCIDELQLSKDSHGRSKFDVYQLSQGVGRTRGNKGGGIDRTPTWALCVLTTGESPLTTESSGAGAVNRVIDIECKASDSVIRDGFGTSACIKHNYGYAGRRFIEAMTDQELDRARERYQQLFKELSSGATTEKQAMSAALLILADELADRHIFHSGTVLTVEKISEFLKTKASVSAGERGYAYMCDWVGSNANRFRSPDDGNTGDIYGKIDGNTVYINSTVFRAAAKAQGFDDRALLSWLRTNGLIHTKKKDVFTIYTSVFGSRAQYVVMQLPTEELPEITDFTDILP